MVNSSKLDNDKIRLAVIDYMSNGDASSYGPSTSWDTSLVTTMDELFRRVQSKKFNEDISKWNVSNVKSMKSMFAGAESFNSDISAWDVSSVENMGEMFSGATEFRCDIRLWNVSKVSNMSYMFENASSFNRDIGSWNIINVKNMSYMFDGAVSIKQSLCWDMSNVISIKNMLRNSHVTLSSYPGCRGTPEPYLINSSTATVEPFSKPSLRITTKPSLELRTEYPPIDCSQYHYSIGRKWTKKQIKNCKNIKGAKIKEAKLILQTPTSTRAVNTPSTTIPLPVISPTFLSVTKFKKKKNSRVVKPHQTHLHQYYHHQYQKVHCLYFIQHHPQQEQNH